MHAEANGFNGRWWHHCSCAICPDAGYNCAAPDQRVSNGTVPACPTSYWSCPMILDSLHGWLGEYRWVSVWLYAFQVSTHPARCMHGQLTSTQPVPLEGLIHWGCVGSLRLISCLYLRHCNFLIGFTCVKPHGVSADVLRRCKWQRTTPGLSLLQQLLLLLLSAAQSVLISGLPTKITTPSLLRS